MPDYLFSNLLEKEFFTKWNQALWTWINATGANLDEITVWYKSWKQFFVDSKLDHLESVKQGFQTGLDMMNQGLSSRNTEIRTEFIPSGSAKSKPTLATPLMTFTDLVEHMASESNIEFIPINRMHSNGKPLYKLGRIVVYLDKKVVFVSFKGEYKPKSVDDAIELAL